MNQGPHGLKPLSVVDDAPHFTLPKVQLSEAPNYKLGEKVKTSFVVIEGAWKLPWPPPVWE